MQRAAERTVRALPPSTSPVTDGFYVFNAPGQPLAEHLEALLSDEDVVFDSDTTYVSKIGQAIEVDQPAQRRIRLCGCEEPRHLVKPGFDGHDHAGCKVTVQT